MASHQKFEFEKNVEHSIWQLPNRVLSPKHLAQAKNKQLLAIILNGMLLAFFGFMAVVIALDNNETNMSIGLSLFLAGLIFLMVCLGFVRYWSGRQLISGRTNTKITKNDRHIMATDTGFVISRRKIQLNQIRELLVKDNFDFIDAANDHATSMPNKMAALVARTKNKDVVLVYGYPFAILRDVGKHLACEIEKELLLAGMKKEHVDVSLDKSTDPIQPSGSSIAVSDTGKSTVYTVRPRGLLSSGYTIVLIATLIAATVVGVFVSGVLQEENSNAALILLLGGPVLCAFLGGALWALHMIFEAVTLTIDKDSMLLVEGSIFGKARQRFRLEDIERVTPGIVVRFKNGTVISLLDQLDVMDSRWLAFQLNRDLFGAAVAEAANLEYDQWRYEDNTHE